MLTIEDILQEASRYVGSIEESEAKKVQRARQIRARYSKKPMRIRIPFWAAIFAGRWQLIYQVSITWRPSVIDPKEGYSGEKIKYKEPGGLQVERGNVRGTDAAGLPLADEEKFTIAQIVEAEEPDVYYVWYVDLVRGVQAFWNYLTLSREQRKKAKLLDRFGSVLMKAKGGGETIYIDLLSRPKAAIKTVTDLSNQVEDGDQAMLNLVKRKDKERR